MTTKELYEEVVDALLDKGVHILMYHSYAYDSIYVKFDYGMGNSLRIADHKSKKTHLDYRYNLLLDVTSPYVDESGEFPKHYYGPNDIQLLINHILLNIEDKKDKYGLMYIHFMKKNIEENKTNRFWRQAKEVKHGQSSNNSR